MKKSLREAQQFVRRQFTGRAADLSPIGEGEWSSAFAMTLDGKDVVIRFGGYVDDFVKDRAMAAHRSGRLPIPRVLEVGATENGYFAVSDRVRGALLDDVDGPGIRAALPSMLSALDAIRDINLCGTRGFGLWRADGAAPFASWADYLLDVARDGGRISGWRARLETSPQAAQAFDHAFGRLRELVADLPPVRRMVHCDLLNRNVLVEAEEVSGIIDWGNALFGDHLYDAAWLIYWWPWYPNWNGIDIKSELARHWQTHGGEPEQVEERLRCCLIHIGLQSVAYNAFKDRWETIERNLDQIAACL